MINEVTIFDGKGNLKEIIPGETLKGKHWKDFKEGQSLINQALARKRAGCKKEDPDNNDKE